LPTNAIRSTRFANAARILDFNARDIATPTSERTRYILAAFINFMRFTQQRAGFVENLREKSDDILEERNKASQELSNYREKISAMKFVFRSLWSPFANTNPRAKQEADEPRCEELRQENASLTAKLVATKEVQTDIAGSCEKLKIQKSDLLQRKA
jgi:kinetochore protein Nuf2